MVKAVTKTFSLPLMPQGNRVRRSAGGTGVSGLSSKNPVKPFPASKEPIKSTKPLTMPWGPRIELVAVSRFCEA